MSGNLILLKKQMVASNNAIYNPQMCHFLMLVRIIQMMVVNSCELCKIFIENKIQKCVKKQPMCAPGAPLACLLDPVLKTLLEKRPSDVSFFFHRMSSVLIALDTTRICPGPFPPDQFFLSQPTTLCSEYIHF